MTRSAKLHKYVDTASSGLWSGVRLRNRINLDNKDYAMADRMPFVGLRLLALAVGVTAAFAGRAAVADTLDQIQKRGVLIWGGDQNGGGPYVFPDEKNPSIPRGFEVELADAIAKSLGVRAEFVQGDWEKVPELINAGRIDIALNGYELTPERESLFLCSVP